MDRNVLERNESAKRNRSSQTNAAEVFFSYSIDSMKVKKEKEESFKTCERERKKRQDMLNALVASNRPIYIGLV